MNRQSSLFIVVALFGVAIGAVAMSRLSQDESSNSQSSADELHQAPLFDPSELEPDQLSGIVRSLSDTLNEEISERRLLAQQLDQLTAEFESLRLERGDDDEGVSANRMASRQVRELRLEEMGFTREELQAIGRLAGAAQFRTVELNDLARREGWINTSRYYEEMEALSTFNSPIRQELGDGRFDRYLYAAGRPNRVIVGTTMEASRARMAGLKSGDVIVRYGGEPVFSNLQLVQLRSSGELDAPVIVEITRDGHPMQITMTRGAMGFGGHEESIDPRTNLWSPAADSE